MQLHRAKEIVQALADGIDPYKVEHFAPDNRAGQGNRPPPPPLPCRVVETPEDCPF